VSGNSVCAYIAPFPCQNSIVNSVAGTDSVATALRMTILHLSSNARVCKTLLAELDEAQLKGTVSSPIRSSEARQLPYLQAVIKEGLRIYPGATPLACKTVPEGGDTVAGYKLPPGTQVGMDVWGALRNTTFWVEDSAVFKPERWLGVPEEQLAAMTECLNFQFGYGRYQCLGIPLIFLELNKTLPEVSLPYPSS
jgi:cytochrome P450